MTDREIARGERGIILAAVGEYFQFHLPAVGANSYLTLLVYPITPVVSPTPRHVVHPNPLLRILMIRERMTLRQALAHAKKCRHQVQPNYSFMKELIKLEASVFGRSSMKMSELAKMNAHYSRAHAVDTQGSRCVVM